MPAINELELKKHIKTGDLSRVYLLHGAEDYLKKLYCRQLADKAVGAGMDDFNRMQFEWKDSSVDEIADAVEMLPVMAEKRCGIVRDFDAESVNAAESAKMTELLKDPPDTCVLIFRLDAVEANLKRSSKWKTFVKKIDAVGCSVELGRRDAASLGKTLCAAAAKLGCTLSPHNASYLVTLCGSDMQTLFHELEKVCAFAGSGEITKEQIKAVATPTLDAGAFDLVRAITRREADKAFSLLDTLFANREEPVMLLAALCSTYADLYRAKVASMGGEPAEALKTCFDYRGKEFRLRNAARDCASLDLSRLRAALELLSKADRMLKGSRTDRRVILEQTVAGLLAV